MILNIINIIKTILLMTTNYTYDEIINKFEIKCDENTDKDLFVAIMNGRV